MQRRPRRLAAEDDEVHLHIGRRHVRAGAEEAAGIAGADREQPFPEQRVAHSGADPLAPAVDHVVHRDRLGAAILDADLEMILQVVADARHVGDHADAMRAQQLGRSEPGKLHQLRRVERASGQDDLAAGAGNPRRAALPVFDPDRAPPLEQDAARQRVGFDDEIGSAPRLAQIADRGRPAPAVLRRELEIAGALLRRPVEIVVARIARLLRGLDERLAQRMRLADIGDGERPADAVQRVLAALLVLGAAEVRQHIVEAPAGIAELPPMIVIRRLAAQIKQAVDRARPAQHLAARLDHLTVVELGLRLGLVEPVHPASANSLP